MTNNNEFKPIYVWAQSKNNESADDFFEISSTGTKRIEDLDLMQRKVYDMNRVVEKSVLSEGKLLSRIKNIIPKDKVFFDSLSVSDKGEKIVLSFGTKDTDIVGRASNIDVFLDLDNISSSNFDEYVNYFYRGFREFCDVTERSPYDLEKILTPDFNKLLNNNLLKKTIDSLPLFLSSKLKYIIAILIILVVYVMISTK